MGKVFWLLLIAALLLCHFLFRAEFLYDWDAVQFALAIDQFDVINHQPHPPGYILLVGLSRLFNIYFQNANHSFLFINLLCQIFSVFFVFTLGKNLFNEKVGRAAALIYAFSPISLFNSHITCPYPAEALAALAIAWSIERSIRLDRLPCLFLATIIFGISGGMRQNLLALLFPLWAFGVVHAIHAKKISLPALGLLFLTLFVVILSWMIPLIYFSGGIGAYHKATSDLLVFLFNKTSVFYGISIGKFLEMLGRLFGWLFILGLGVATIPLFIFIGKNREMFSQKSFWMARKTQFFLLWIFPSFAFYGLFHLPKPGYLLTYLGAFCILAAYALNTLWPKVTLSTKSLVVGLFLLAYFVIPQRLTEQSAPKIPRTARDILYGLGPKYGLYAIQNRDHYLGTMISYIQNNFDSEKAVIVTESWPQHSYPMRRLLRHVMYYLPSYHIYEISSPPGGVKPSVFHAWNKKAVNKSFSVHEFEGMLQVKQKSHDLKEGNPEVQRLHITQRQLLFLTDDFVPPMPASGWQVHPNPSGQTIYFADLNRAHSITHGPITIE